MSDTRRRHLRPVPEDPAEGIPMGVSWEADTDPEPTTDQEVPEVPDTTGSPLEATRVYADTEPDGALTPAEATRADLTDRVKASIAATHTYALFAWSRRWETSMAYVMDPALRQEMIDQAEENLDQRRRQAAKKAGKALAPEDKRAAQRTVERLENRTVSELEVDARVLRARAARLAGRCAIPAAVIVGPVLLAASGVWAGLLIWPAAWGWLGLQGRALARAEFGATATEAPAIPPEEVTAAVPSPVRPPASPSPVDDRARALVEAASGAAVAATVLGATEDENRILKRLHSWNTEADKRGLTGVKPDAPTLDESGIGVVLHTTGKLTPADLRKKVPAVRALLGVPTDTSMDITPGKVGDQALLRIRTRTVARDLTWEPDRPGIGVDVDTGEDVELTPYHRMLIAGASRSGKTVLLRVLMAKVALDPNARLVLIDAKRVEAARWKHVARSASTPEGISSLVAELKHEMDDRYREIAATGNAFTPTPDRPRLVIVVDEGAEVISSDNRELQIMAGLRSLAMMGGEAEIHLWWCTQKPTMTGPGRGIDNAIAGQMTGARVCLRVTDPKEARTVLGEDATSKGWNAHELERAGLALVRDGARGPVPVAVWDLSDEQEVRALPARSLWKSAARLEAEEDLARADDEPADAGGDPAEVGEAAESGDWIGAQGTVMSTLQSLGPRTLAQLEKELDYSRTMIYNALKQLQAAGRVDQVSGRGSAWRAL
ncbi:FtsK/SpoIIIE domain-containing protein [Nocardiopsis protaetiae]|uniref:FtsK/SpoIIIE domain-containing protein n=1 Tax=Nocardiopsis protaetiae TaxID=3382270 RepID=UPI00387B6214